MRNLFCLKVVFFLWGVDISKMQYKYYNIETIFYFLCIKAKTIKTFILY